MGNRDSTMYKSTFYLFYLLVLCIIPSQAKPGALDTGFKVAGAVVAAKVVKSALEKDCGDYEYSWGEDECAIVFDEEDCGESTFGWSPLKIKTGERSFSLLSTYARYKNDIESIIVRSGCTLNGYLNSDCEGTEGKDFYAFKRGRLSGLVKGDKVYEDLKEDSNTEKYDKKIQCVVCTC